MMLHSRQTADLDSVSSLAKSADGAPNQVPGLTLTGPDWSRELCQCDPDGSALVQGQSWTREVDQTPEDRMDQKKGTVSPKQVRYYYQKEEE